MTLEQFLFGPEGVQQALGFLALIPLIAAGVNALGGYLGSRKGSRTGQQEMEEFLKSFSTQTQTGTSSTTRTPTYDPQALQFRNQLLAATRNLIGPGGQGNATMLADSIADAAIRGANQAAAGASANVEADLASRGLSISPAAVAAKGNVENQRISNIVNALARRPLVSSEVSRANLATAGNVFRSIPFGTTAESEFDTTSIAEANQNRRQRGTAVQPGSAMGTALSAFGQGLIPWVQLMLAQQYGQNSADSSGGFTINDMLPLDASQPNLDLLNPNVPSSMYPEQTFNYGWPVT